mmetsp:Transcript_17413/g.59750  ORF Transcript_17413/g.59750 Transcript_17413/m.59750 type:complete len:555 (+) Transcript_17413:499-2163(+)
MDDVPRLVQQDVAVVPVLDVEDVAEQRVRGQRRGKVARRGGVRRRARCAVRQGEVRRQRRRPEDVFQLLLDKIDGLGVGQSLDEARAAAGAGNGVGPEPGVFDAGAGEDVGAEADKLHGQLLLPQVVVRFHQKRRHAPPRPPRKRRPLLQPRSAFRPVRKGRIQTPEQPRPKQLAALGLLRRKRRQCQRRHGPWAVRRSSLVAWGLRRRRRSVVGDGVNVQRLDPRTLALGIGLDGLAKEQRRRARARRHDLAALDVDGEDLERLRRIERVHGDPDAALRHEPVVDRRQLRLQQPLLSALAAVDLCELLREGREHGDERGRVARRLGAVAARARGPTVARERRGPRVTLLHRVLDEPARLQSELRRPRAPLQQRAPQLERHRVEHPHGQRVGAGVPPAGRAVEEQAGDLREARLPVGVGHVLLQLLRRPDELAAEPRRPLRARRRPRRQRDRLRRHGPASVDGREALLGHADRGDVALGEAALRAQPPREQLDHLRHGEDGPHRPPAAGDAASTPAAREDILRQSAPPAPRRPSRRPAALLHAVHGVVGRPARA